MICHLIRIEKLKTKFFHRTVVTYNIHSKSILPFCVVVFSNVLIKGGHFKLHNILKHWKIKIFTPNSIEEFCLRIGTTKWQFITLKCWANYLTILINDIQWVNCGRGWCNGYTSLLIHDANIIFSLPKSAPLPLVPSSLAGFPSVINTTFSIRLILHTIT